MSTSKQSLRIITTYRSGRFFLHIMGLIVMATIFFSRPNYIIIGIVFLFAFVWPQVAFLISKNSGNTKTSEDRNVLFDMFVYGSFINFISFSLWPSMAFLVGPLGVLTLHGGLRFLLKGLLIMIFGFLTAGLFGGFEFTQEASTLTTFVSAIIMLMNAIALGFMSFNAAINMAKLKEDVKIQKEQIEGLAGKLAKYLSPQVYGSIFSGEKEVKIETHRKKLTIFFSDIKDFTSITDSMEAEGLTSLLNTYFNEMSIIALAHGGTLDKFIGDAIMIFFGDPKSNGEKDDALACVKMALEMRTRMKELHKEWETLGVFRPLRIRMGINTGFCTVGNFGSEERMDYTIIGNQVNLASRLESNADSDQILISNETYALVKDMIACDKKDEIHVKGIPYPVQTYQVIDVHEKIDKAVLQIQEEYEGFRLSVDFSKVSKNQAAVWLKEVLKTVEK